VWRSNRAALAGMLWLADSVWLRTAFFGSFFPFFGIVLRSL